MGLNSILNPLTDNRKLKKLCKTYFYDDMKSLLVKIEREFPKAKIIVTGYFVIVSKHTKLTKLLVLVAIFSFTLGLILALAKREMVKQSSLFGRESTKQISRAVAWKNSSFNKKRKINPSGLTLVNETLIVWA